MKKIFTLLLLSFFTVSFVSAQSLLNEQFNYSTGNLTTVGAPAWVSFAGGNNPVRLQVVEGSLNYPGYDTSTITNRVQLDTVAKNGEAAFTRFTTQKAGTIYYSFLLNVLEYANLAGGNAARGESFIALLPNILNSPSLAAVQIRRGKRNETFSLGIASRDTVNGGAAATAWDSSSLSSNNTYLVVVSYQVVAGDNNNVVSMWINPRTDTTVLLTPNVTTTDSDTGGDTTNIGKVGLFQNSARTPSALIDALKVGLSWNDLVLPLKLLSFNVIDNSGFASLTWQTCNELNVKTFEVQRSSDARNFVTIGNLAAKNGSCGTTYTYRDAKELAGTAFYRIHVVDNDGRSFYSAIVSINGILPTKISVFPNPVVNNLVLSHPKAADGAMIKIVSLSGSIVATHSVQKDAVQTSVDVSKLAKGNYIVIFSNAKQQQTIKILKQ